MNMDPLVLKKELGYLILYMAISIPVLVLYLWLSKKARKEWLVLMGQLRPKESYGWERRKFIRLNTVFPVEFQKIDANALGSLHEGFTKDVSKIGMCLEAKTQHGGRIEDIIPDKTKLKLTINTPIHAEPVEAIGVVKWIQKLEGPDVDKYLMGIFYEKIKETDASLILKYALWLYRKPIFLTAAITLLILVIAALFTVLSGLGKSKARLQYEMDSIYQERKKLVERIKEAEHGKAKLDTELQKILSGEKKISEKPTIVVEEEKASEPQYGRKEELSEGKSTSDLEVELENVLKEKKDLEEKLGRTESEEGYKEEENLVEEEAGEEPETEIQEEEAAVAETKNVPEAIEETPSMEKITTEEARVKGIFRDYILKENIQLLDRYCYQHKSSVYHAASLFALAELRYKYREDWTAIQNTYEEVIKLYPRSKYATYASHRLDQLKRKLPYGAYTLRYYFTLYDLPPLLDYRQIEPYYKEE